MTNRHTRDDWRRLGRAVQAARTRRKGDGLDDMQEWASEIGRTTRVLLGLERGERTGAVTLRLIEDALNWPPGWCDVILDDPTADLAPEMPKPAPMDLAPFEPDARELDSYTTAELLAEVEDRFAHLALELHSLGRPTVTIRKEGQETVYEPVSPAARRAMTRGGPTAQATREGQTGDTPDDARE